MPLVELPITSYFARAPQNKKRKAVAPPKKQAKPKRKRVDNVVQPDLDFPVNPVASTSNTPRSPSSQASSGPAALPPVVGKGKTVQFAIDLTDIMDCATSSTPENIEESVPSSQSQYVHPLPSVRSHYIQPLFQSSGFQNGDVDAEPVPSSQSQYFPPPPIRRPEDSPAQNGSPPPELEHDEDVPSSQSQWLLPTAAYDDVPSSQSQYDHELVPSRSVVDLKDAFETPLPSLDVEKNAEDSETESDDDFPISQPPVAPQDAASQSSSLPQEITDFFEMFGDESSYPSSFPQSLQATP
ncbi:hypothetical protein C8F01DRAFT_1116523 [Mycena amicta]|nr:hypothetical protein C8F01DRAFT_1116523 [Mycena amicta]